jgi:hypothetical protein
MSFGPVWSAMVVSNDGFEPLKEIFVRHVELVGLVLDNSQPTGRAVAWTQPYIVGSGEPNFDGKVGAQAVWI